MAFVETIGTAQTHTTIQAWEDDLAADLTAESAGEYRGECLAEAFTASTDLEGHTTDATHYYHLTSQADAEHDGRAHEVSGAGNARIEFVGTASAILQVRDEYTSITWLEIKGPGNNNANLLTAIYTGGTGYIHHNLLHNNLAAGSSTIYGITGNIYSGGTVRIYRNIVYGCDMPGLFPDRGGANSVLLCHTLYQNDFRAFYGSIRTDDTNYAIKANACFDNPNTDIYGVLGTLDWNYTADTTGDDEGANGVANLTTANQFLAPTTTWANTDLLPKAGADILAQMTSAERITAFGANYLTDYPDIDEPINDRGVSITGDWDIGAGQLAAAPPTGIARRKVNASLAHGSPLIRGGVAA